MNTVSINKSTLDFVLSMIGMRNPYKLVLEDLNEERRVTAVSSMMFHGAVQFECDDYSTITCYKGGAYSISTEAFLAESSYAARDKDIEEAMGNEQVVDLREINGYSIY